MEEEKENPRIKFGLFRFPKSMKVIAMNEKINSDEGMLLIKSHDHEFLLKTLAQLQSVPRIYLQSTGQIKSNHNSISNTTDIDVDTDTLQSVPRISLERTKQIDIENDLESGKLLTGLLESVQADSRIGEQIEYMGSDLSHEEDENDNDSIVNDSDDSEWNDSHSSKKSSEFSEENIDVFNKDVENTHSENENLRDEADNSNIISLNNPKILSLNFNQNSIRFNSTSMISDPSTPDNLVEDPNCSLQLTNNSRKSLDPENKDDICEKENNRVVSSNNDPDKTINPPDYKKLKVVRQIPHTEGPRICLKKILKCFSKDYKKCLSRMASESHGEARGHRNLEMPTVDDINCLLNYLSELRKTFFNKLQEEFTEKHYLQLLKATLTSLQVYNRRLPGDVEKITLDDWARLKSVNKTTKIYIDLSDGLQDLVGKFNILYVRGKLGRDIKLLVPADVQICITKLIDNRHNLDINEKNRYLFALPQTALHTIRHPSGYILLKKFASQCGATNSGLLTATRIRKQLTTACVHLNVIDNEISDLAQYMGHQPNIHRSHYRQNIIDRDIPMFLKFLNTALDYKDDKTPKNLDEIENSILNSDISNPNNQEENSVISKRENTIIDNHEKGISD